MQLAGIDQIQAFLADALEAWQDFFHRRLHDSRAAFIAGEIQVEMFAHEAIRDAGKSIERILDAVAEKLAPEYVVINGNAQREFHRGLRTAVPEVQIVFPAGVEEFPLEVG